QDPVQRQPRGAGPLDDPVDEARAGAPRPAVVVQHRIDDRRVPGRPYEIGQRVGRLMEKGLDLRTHHRSLLALHAALFTSRRRSAKRASLPAAIWRNGMRQVTLPDGTAVPQLGLGTWHMGERAK